MDKPEETQSYLDRYPPPAQPASQTVSPQGLPASADLSQYQTPVKNQNPRGTCTNFAAVAAIEAQYKLQYGLTLDLSEQWVTQWCAARADFGHGAHPGGCAQVGEEQIR